MKGPCIHVFRERLEAKRSALLRSLQATRESVADPVSPVPNFGEREAALQSLMRESRLLWIVESALQGIAEGMFGRCLFCQREIPAKLLAAVPWTAYCSSCQKLAEAYVNRPAETSKPA